MKEKSTYCGHCHECGKKLHSCLDGEEYCPGCKEYKRYKSHGWGYSKWNDPVGECPEVKES